MGAIIDLSDAAQHARFPQILRWAGSVGGPILFRQVQSFLDDVRRYVGLDAEDGERLQGLVPLLEPHFNAFAEHFYARILEHPSAHTAITGGAEQVARLKQSLVTWMDSGLRGPFDDAFYERRARIGRRHVAIGLPQQYMVTAIGVMRQDYHAVLTDTLVDDVPRLHASMRAVDRLLDLELAIMLQTYRIDSDDQLRRGERLATIGRVAATIGHDLRNPLGVIESSAYILRRMLQDERGQRHLDKINSQVRNCNRIVTALLELARSRPPQFASIDVRVMLDASLAMVTIPEGVVVRIEVDDGMQLEGDSNLLEQAMINLVVNSVIALRGRPGTIVTRATRHDDRFAALIVVDDGPGFDPDLLPRVFEPLVTSRASGVGLGLALVKSVADRHLGQAIAENAPGGGAIVRLLLPWRGATATVASA
ncbi:MAG: histidine kinase [Myxococcales bacterium]|nr:histidine kinase [Myxococcales bacterium]